jgi:integrase/recombinase XerD
MSVYIRRKEPGIGWRYRRVPKTGRPPQSEGCKFHVRFRDAAGKYVWSQPYDTLEQAREAAAGLEVNAKAVALGLTVKEYEDSKNSHRVLIKAAISAFLSDAAKTKKPKSVATYTLNLKQFEESLKVRFLDEVTKPVLCAFRDHLSGKGYEARTLHNRMMTVLSLLKKNKIKTDFSLSADLPEYEQEPAIPYEPDTLAKIFAGMSPAETVRYKFFLGTACREQEVMYAAWPDIDLKSGVYHVRRKPDVGFTPKKHESRDVPMSDALVSLLKEWKKSPEAGARWLFPNGNGEPDGHLLKKFKRLALRAGVNCGHCTAPWTTGRYEKKKSEVSCATHPVCHHHYLHRLRKTRASDWEAAGIPVRTIQFWLGHKSLETTQKYLGVGNLASLRDKINAADLAL